MSLSATTPTVLADAFLTSRSRLTDVALVVTGTAVVALAAQISVPLWPVPITAQTLAVLLVGASLGPRRGASSLLLYAVVGLAGLPVFADWTGGVTALAKPSFGFVIGFIPCAMLAGWLATRRVDRRFWSAWGWFALVSAVPFLFGLPYLALALNSMGIPTDLVQTLQLGLFPFIVGGIVKAAIAAAVIPLAWKGVSAIDKRKSSDA